MKKIITALANPKLSLKIKEECEVEIVIPDIQYQEGVLEALEKNKNIEILILNSLIEGNLNIYDFINRIKEKNTIINIIIILDEKDIELENFLNAKRISDIFYNNKDTIKELIKRINEDNSIKNEQEINEEIKKLKELILEKNSKKFSIKNNINKIKNVFNKFNNKTKKTHKGNIESKENKIITVIGTSGSGKSTFCAVLTKLIKNKKVLIVDCNSINNSINSIFGVKIENRNITKINSNNSLLNLKNNKNIVQKIKNLSKKYDLILIDLNKENNLENMKEIFGISNLIIFISEANLIEIEKSKNLLDVYREELKMNKEKLNIVFNKFNCNCIEEKILQNIFFEINILGKINLTKKYDLAINSNLKIIDKKIKSEYLKIIDKVNKF